MFHVFFLGGFCPYKARSFTASGTCQVLGIAGECSPGQSIASMERLHTSTLGEWAITCCLRLVEKVEESEQTWKMQRKAQRISKIHQNNPKHVMLGYLGWFYTQSGCFTGPKSLTLSQAMLWTLTPLLSSDAAKDSRETPAVSRPLVPAAKKNVMRFEWFDQIFCRWNSDDFFVEPW